jgi:MFS transporter, putative metabolite:H+ symporter
MPDGVEGQVGMLRALDESPVTRRYWILAAAVMVGAVLDLFDFFLIAFVVPIVSDEWDLTFGEAAVVLLSAGFGAIAGSILWGRFGDRYGRRRPLVAGLLTFSLATGALALAPDDGWWFLGIGRFIVGAGVAGVAVIAVPMVLEFTPTRLRTKITGFVTTAMVPIGILAAALATAALDPHWRPLFAIGLLPSLLAIFVLVYVPESPRWLLERGRVEDARRVIAFLLMRPPEELALEVPDDTQEEEPSYSELLRYRASVRVTVLAWFGASVAVAGLVLWGPTFLEEILEIDSDEAALLFGLVTVGSFAGRLCFSFLPQRTGRRFCGLLMGFGAPPLLALAALSGETEIGGASLFLLALIAAAFFVDGGFANLTPYTSEVFPTRLRTHGMGLAWLMSGLGRIVGPLVIALIAGTDDLIDPEATLDALPPAFLFLAAFSLLVGAAFVSVRLEPHGRDLETLAAELTAEAAPPPAETVPVR